MSETFPSGVERDPKQEAVASLASAYHEDWRRVGTSKIIKKRILTQDVISKPAMKTGLMLTVQML